MARASIKTHSITRCGVENASRRFDSLRWDALANLLTRLGKVGSPCTSSMTTDQHEVQLDERPSRNIEAGSGKSDAESVIPHTYSGMLSLLAGEALKACWGMVDGGDLIFWSAE